jgi:transcriptional regulator of acetoin/glycerol metabolism
MSQPLLPHVHDQPASYIDVEPSTVTYSMPDTHRLQPALAALPQYGPKQLSRERIVRAYQRAAGNLTQAARSLGVHKATLYRRLKALGLSREELEALSDSPAPVEVTADT